MELNLNPRVKNRESLGKPSPAREQKAQAEPLSPVPGQAREDRIELSQEALEHLRNQQQEAEQAGAGRTEPLSPEEKRRQAQAEKLKAARQMVDAMRQQSAQMKEQSEKQADALKKSMDKMKKCARIARNMGKGHKVPPEDEKYLLENDPKAYMMAIILRMMEEEKDKVKSELDEEDLEQEQSGGESVDAAEGAGGGSPPAAADAAEVSVE